jgi:hypothetical protein
MIEKLTNDFANLLRASESMMGARQAMQCLTEALDRETKRHNEEGNFYRAAHLQGAADALRKEFNDFK